MAKYQILHPYPEWPIQCTATLLVSIKSLSNADSDAVESLKNFVWIKTYETLGISLYIFLFSSSNTWPYPFVSTFNQLPIGLQVLNLIQSFFTNIYRTHFLDFWIFSPLFGRLKNQLDLVVFFAMKDQTCPMVQSFNQLPIAVQVWNLVQSIFKRISRTFFFNHELRIFSHFLDFSKITFNFYDCDPNLPLPIDSEFKHPSVYWYSAL